MDDQEPNDHGAAPAEPLDFDTWAALSAALLDLDASLCLALLAEVGIAPDHWTRSDHHHRRALVDDLAKAGTVIDHVNIGGGLGIDYGKGDALPPSPAEYGAAVRAALVPLAAHGVTIVCEPGRAIVGRSGALVAIETSVNIAYGYDIRGEVIGETGTVSLAEQNEVVLKVKGAFSGRVFADWPERFDPAFDAEFRAWIIAAAKGGAAGPSAWDGYVATAATLAGVKALASGAREPISLRDKPALYA